MVTTLKKGLDSSLARRPVQVAQTPSGNVNPHQPMLKGKPLAVRMLMRAKDSQPRAAPDISSAVSRPIA